MDAFYASVEQRDEPRYRGRPLIVGGQPNSRGVVAACSYEARRFGIHSAMACARAYRLCPDAVFVPPRFTAYRAVSEQIHAVFRAFTAQVEPLSLDEAYLDVTGIAACDGSATRIAEAIKQRIVETTGLTASAGVSYNKFLAKIASDVNKPDGLFVIRPEHGAAFVAALPIGRFHGIGKVTERRMRALGIHTGADLGTCPLEVLQTHFGKAAGYYHDLARGIDPRPVIATRERKSIGAETTFVTDLQQIAELWSPLDDLIARVARQLDTAALQAHTATLKVKYADFAVATRSVTTPHAITDATALRARIQPLLGKTAAGARAVRLIGVSVSGLAPRTAAVTAQLALFE